MLSFILALFTFLASATDETTVTPTTTDTHTSAPVASSCEKSMREADCAEFFEENDIPVADRRNCSAGVAELALDQVRGLTLYCASGFYQSWEAYAQFIGGGVSGMWNKIIENSANRERFMKMMNDCDLEATLDCKRALADSAHLTLTDDQLRSRSSLTIHGLAQKRLRSQARQKALREATDFNSLPYEEKINLFEQSRANNKHQWDAMKNMIQRQLDAAGVRWACYNGAKTKELYCYGLGMVVDPLIAFSASTKVLRLTLGLRGPVTFEQLVKKLGFTPATKHEPVSAALPNNYNVSLHNPSVPANYNTLAQMDYVVQGDTILVGTVRTETAYQRKGLAEYMFGQMLAKHPKVKQVSTSLTTDNAKTLEKYLKPDGSNCIEAFKKTSAYRIRARFNFTRIISARCVPETHEYDFVVGRD